MKIEERHLKIVETILQKYPYSFYIFGSRATNKARPLSDLDLCFFEDIPSNLLLKLEEEFEESDLPYKVDLVNWNTCTADFQDRIKKNMVCLQKGPSHLEVTIQQP